MISITTITAGLSDTLSSLDTSATIRKRSFNVDQPQLGRLIELIRRHKCITRAELAKEAGIHPANVWRIENAKIKRPDPFTLRDLANALGIDSGELI